MLPMAQSASYSFTRPCCSDRSTLAEASGSNGKLLSKHCNETKVPAVATSLARDSPMPCGTAGLACEECWPSLFRAPASVMCDKNVSQCYQHRRSSKWSSNTCTFSCSHCHVRCCAILPLQIFRHPVTAPEKASKRDLNLHNDTRTSHTLVRLTQKAS